MRGIVVASFLVLALTSPALAQQGQQPPPQEPPGPKPGDQVGFCGRVVALVESGCIGIVGQTLTIELTAVTPKPEVGTIVQGTGIVGGQMTKCMQGLHLQSASYSKTDLCTSGP